MVRRRYRSLSTARFVLYHPNFVPVKSTYVTKGQDECRSPKKIFLPHEVFNTNVDKVVEISRLRRANLQPFNALLRFALFVCNFIFSFTLTSQSLRKSNGGRKIIL